MIISADELSKGSLFRVKNKREVFTRFETCFYKVVTIGHYTSDCIKVDFSEEEQEDKPPKIIRVRIPDLVPVPLSGKLLNYFDFTRHHQDYYNETILVNGLEFEEVTAPKEGFYISYFPKDLGSAIEIKKGVNVKFLHEIQRIQKALTGKDLKFKIKNKYYDINN